MTTSNDVKKKLDELYNKTDDIRKELIGLHRMLTAMNFFGEKETPPVPGPPPVITQPIPPPPPKEEPVVPPLLKPFPYFEKQKEKSSYSRFPDLEKFIGERLVTFIGIVVLVTGIFFLVKFAIDRNWIGEAGRSMMGFVAGGILLGFAYRLRKRFTTFSSVLAGGGIAVFYFTLTYAFQVYHLFSQPVAFGLLALVTAFSVFLSVRFDRLEFAVLAGVGGFTSPLMVSTGQMNFNVLCTYLLILNAGMLALAWYKKWNLVNYISYIFTILLFSGALIKDFRDETTAHYASAFIFATLFYTTFFGMNIIHTIRRRTIFTGPEIIILLSNAFFFFVCGYFILHKMHLENWQGPFTILLAAFNGIFALLLRKRLDVDRLLVLFLIGLVISLVSLAGPIQLDGNHITLFWAAESLVLLYLFRRSGIILLRTGSVITIAATLFSLAYNWSTYYPKFLSGSQFPLFLNTGFVTGFCVALALAIKAWMMNRAGEHVDSFQEKKYSTFLQVMAALILYLTGTFEITFQASFEGNYAAAIAVYFHAFTVLFLLASWFVFKKTQMEYADLTYVWLTFIIALLYPYFPNDATSAVRDNMLTGYTGAIPFIFHFIGLAGTVALLILAFKKIIADKNLAESMRTVFLWIMCGLFVFMITAEVDHFVLYSQYPFITAAGNYLEFRYEALAQSQKIIYPVVWGICSLVMIAIGIQKRERHLRIIALLLFAVTVGKLISLGIYGESQAGKIIAFIVSGIILLLVSFMYQRLKVFLNDEATAAEEKAEE